MFRAQQNAFDDLVVKATDENLTSENWEYILDVCDKVASEDSGGKDVVAAIIKRLAHRNANVQLYTLELANALSQNCGLKIHKELASRSFTDALLRLAGDRNTHQQVKAKILERMAEWTEMFSKDPDLGILEQAYVRLKSQNPNLHPPSKPIKTQITEADRKKEEEELQMALALSIKEKASISVSSAARAAQAKSSPPLASSTGSSQTPQSHAVPSGTTAATVSRVRALFDFQPSEPGELQFRKGDIIAVLESVYKDWWKGSLRGKTGIFPLNYVEKLQDPTRDELEREAQMEGEVFAEIRNVEKLLALLSTSSKPGDGDVRENEEITALYHSTLAIRPKLIELIGKYSQKKDDFTQLNEKFIKARRDYENLLEASMSQPLQPSYGRPSYGYSAALTYNVPGGLPQQPQGGLPQAEQQRLYSSIPQPEVLSQPRAQESPQPIFMATPQAQQQRFHAQQQQQQQHQPIPPMQSTPKPQSADPYAPQSRVSMMGRPQSFASPQELASSSYDSPADARTTFVPQHQLQGENQDGGYEPTPYAQAPTQSQSFHHHHHHQHTLQSSYDSPSSVYSTNPDTVYSSTQQQNPPLPMHGAPVAQSGTGGPVATYSNPSNSIIVGPNELHRNGGGTSYVAYQPPTAPPQGGSGHAQGPAQRWQGDGEGSMPYIR